MVLETLCNIPAKPPEWVWKGAIPEGQLTLLIGKPGVEKSMFAMDVIARSTKGQRGLSDLEQGEPGSLNQAPNEIRQANFGNVGQLRPHKNPMK